MNTKSWTRKTGGEHQTVTSAGMDGKTTRSALITSVCQAAPRDKNEEQMVEIHSTWSFNSTRQGNEGEVAACLLIYFKLAFKLPFIP